MQITSQSENPNIYPAPKPHLLPHPGHYIYLQPLRSDHLQPERATPLTFDTDDMRVEAGLRQWQVAKAWEVQN